MVPFIAAVIFFFIDAYMEISMKFVCLLYEFFVSDDDNYILRLNVFLTGFYVREMN